MVSVEIAEQLKQRALPGESQAFESAPLTLFRR